MTTRIAIAGPDGAGKTTVCEKLHERLPDAHIAYAGKARNHTLATTRFAYRVLVRAQAIWAPLYFPFRYFWFYIFEYFENRNRFKEEPPRGIQHMVYDRHPIDRMVLPVDLALKRRYGRIGRLRWACELLPRLFWAWIYRSTFRSQTIVFVLLPDANLCYTRSGSQYTELIEAFIRIESYRQTALSLKRQRQYILIKITAEMTSDDVVETIAKHLNVSGDQPF